MAEQDTLSPSLSNDHQTILAPSPLVYSTLESLSSRIKRRMDKRSLEANHARMLLGALASLPASASALCVGAPLVGTRSEIANQRINSTNPTKWPRHPVGVSPSLPDQRDPY